MKTLNLDNFKMLLDLDIEFTTGQVLNPDYNPGMRIGWINPYKVRYMIRKEKLRKYPSTGISGMSYTIGIWCPYKGNSSCIRYTVKTSIDIEAIWHKLAIMGIKRIWARGSKNNQFKLDYEK